MLFVDVLERRWPRVEKCIPELFNLALQNQTHEGDLLLLLENGFYNKEYEGLVIDGVKRSPYVVGPGEHGHSEQTHYRFINKYRQQISGISLIEHLESVKPDIQRKEDIDQIIKSEEMSIQIEMLIYLKFWEADMTIKKMHELINIIHGESYNWYFKVKESNRDIDATGKRDDLIRKSIRNRIKNKNKDFYLSIKESYLSQLRNAIAHSRFAILGRNIWLNNYVKEDKGAQLKQISFNDWIERFHETLLIHNGLIKLDELIRKHYKEIALAYNNLVEVRITKKDGSEVFKNMQYHPEIPRWSWEQKNKN